MDALSMLLEDVHLYQTQYFYINAQGDWAFNFGKKDSIVFYLVLSGAIQLTVGETSRVAIASDLMMVPSGRAHQVTSVGNRLPQPVELAPLLANDAQQPVELGRKPLLGDKLTDKLDQTSKQAELSLMGATGATGETTRLVVIVCHYDYEITHHLLAALPEILPEQRGHEEQRQMMMDIGTRFLSLESSQQRLGKTAIINRLASILMIECLRTYIEDLPTVTGNWLLALKDPYLSKALTAMHDHPEYDWTIYRLAEVAGMSRSSFAEHFRQVVGHPPLTYLTDYRLRLAARYLRLQENSISRISELVGYASDSTFSQAFKRVYGVSPRKYRQQFRCSLGASSR